ncbi:MAG: divergent polysaccharide deacetylase family protein [candidate division Zixibacteria bacterium]|nr:divergent polysaccharide deacetylase family protein [candidate division Zixibacteria bacterium]
MRFRKSRADRQEPERKSLPYDSLLPRIALLLASASVAGWGVWYFMTANEPLNFTGWFSEEPSQVETIVYELPKTAEAKTLQETYQSIEFAIAQALNNLQADPARIKERQPWRPLSDSTWQPAQRTLRVSSAYSLSQCNHEIARNVRRAGAEVIAATENSRTRELSLLIAFGGQVTHDLTIIRDPDIVKKTGKMVVVLEDIGTAVPEVARGFLTIGRPLTFGLVSWKGQPGEMAREAREKKHGLVAQIPMEPYEYPGVSPGRRAVLVEQSDPQNRQVVRDALAAVPEAGGAMAYLGSRILGDSRMLTLVLEEVKTRNLYFLDALAGRGSAGASIAGRLQVRHAAIWGAIDAVDNQERIAAMLDMASYEALDRGQVVVSGRARPNTLAVLKSRLERLELRGIRFVPVDSLFHSPK